MENDETSARAGVLAPVQQHLQQLEALVRTQHAEVIQACQRQSESVHQLGATLSATSSQPPPHGRTVVSTKTDEALRHELVACQLELGRALRRVTDLESRLSTAHDDLARAVLGVEMNGDGDSDKDDAQQRALAMERHTARLAEQQLAEVRARLLTVTKERDDLLRAQRKQLQRSASGSGSDGSVIGSRTVSDVAHEAEKLRAAAQIAELREQVRQARIRNQDLETSLLEHRARLEIASVENAEAQRVLLRLRGQTPTPDPDARLEELRKYVAELHQWQTRLQEAWSSEREHLHQRLRDANAMLEATRSTPSLPTALEPVATRSRSASGASSTGGAAAGARAHAATTSRQSSVS